MSADSKKTTAKTEVKQKADSVSLNGGLGVFAKWINPERQRPKDGQKIIFENAIGLFWGIFCTTGSGIVYVANKLHDSVDWEDIYCWIPYPKEFYSKNARTVPC
jgi:hypothetical protein